MVIFIVLFGEYVQLLDRLKNIQSTKGRAKHTNKNNLLSVFAEYNGKKVKIYEAFNQEQVDLRLYIDQHDQVSHYFPRVINSDGLLIAEEFIEGTHARNCNVDVLRKEVGKLILTLRSIDYNKCTWDYLEHIHKRVSLPFTPLLLPNHINHNDLTIDNIIMTENGIKVIDNEFLACNNAWFMNVINAKFLTDPSLVFGIDSDVVQKYWKVRKSWKV